MDIVQCFLYLHKHYWSPTFHLFGSALSCSAFQLNPATDRKDTLFYVLMSENSRERSQAKLCETNLKLPHQKRYKGSVDAALGDENTVGELGSVCEPQISLCRKSKHSDEGFKQETSSALCGEFISAAALLNTYTVMNTTISVCLDCIFRSDALRKQNHKTTFTSCYVTSCSWS